MPEPKKTDFGTEENRFRLITFFVKTVKNPGYYWLFRIIFSEILTTIHF